MRGTTVQLGTLDIKFFTNPSRPHQQYPELTSRIKAAETRHLVPIVLDIFRDVHDPELERDRDVLAVLEGLTGLYEVIDTEDLVLSEADADKFQGHVWTMMYHYRALRVGAGEAKMWNEVPKFHFTWHVADCAKYTNPRTMWCYSDEDFMGIMKRIAEASVVGTSASHVGRKIVERWYHGAMLRLVHNA